VVKFISDGAAEVEAVKIISDVAAEGEAVEHLICEPQSGRAQSVPLITLVSSVESLVKH